MNAAQGLLTVAEGLGLVGGATTWKGFWDHFAGDDRVLAFMNESGKQPEVGVAIDYPSVQVLGRGTASVNGYQALSDKMLEVFNALHAIPQEVGKPLWADLTSCIARGTIQNLGKDENNRPMMSLNFNLITAPQNLGHRPNY